MNTSRRRFLKAAAVGAGAMALAPAVAYSKEAASFGPNEVGMLYDSTLCVGCKACVYACRKANFFSEEQAPAILSKEDEKEVRWFNDYELNYRTKNIIKMYSYQEAEATDPSKVTDKVAFIKRQCNHCNQPGCVSACPVGAMTKNAITGIVEYDKNKCIGCRYCMIACPFGVPTFEWHRALPRISKCELCRDTHLLTAGLPACCDVCPTKAVIYGKRVDLMAEAKNRQSNEPNKYQSKIYGEADYGGTNVIYLSKVNFEHLGLPNLPTHSFASESEHIQHTLYKTFFHVPVAPVIVYAALAVIAVKHQKKRNNNGGRDE